MSFKQLEADFQRKLKQYKSTYQDYLVEIKNQMGAYWNTEENVTVSNRIASAQIPYLTDPDISKEACLHACSSDEKCKYVLFSDSGNGECAANQCLKWTKDAKGLIPLKNESKTFNIFVGNSNNPSKTVTLPELGIKVSPTPTNAPGDDDKNMKFKVSVEGTALTVTRTDKSAGWGQMLQLKGTKAATPGVLTQNKACAPGKGPSETHYVYSGWEKPTWKDEENVSFMGEPSEADPIMWKDLGDANNLLACKEMSLSSAKGPFSSVVFVSDKKMCYGGVPEARNQNIKMDGIYSAIPPTGSTGLGGKAGVEYIEKLKTLNDELNEDLYKMKQSLAKMQVADQKTADLIAQTQKNIHSDYGKLKSDREKLNTMSKDLTTIDARLGLLDRVETREKMMYMGSALLVVIFLTYMIRKSS